MSVTARQTLFSVDIWQFQFPDPDYLGRLCDPEFLATLSLERLDYISPSDLRTTARSWERIPGTDRIHDLAILLPVRDFVLEKAQMVWQELDYYHDQSPKIYQSWINATGQGGFVLPHIHHNAALSAVVYFDARPGMGNIVFENPMDLALCAQPMSRKAQRTRREVPVKTGDVIVFPGWLRHYTTPNHTCQDRISFVANFNATGESYDPLASSHQGSGDTQ